ncbi:hydrogenase nickel incorporation protein HypB [Legionella bononiensis]|uniref:Hydrogenase maturation factor HypB n=1 Tax=Legionella bononiensis TaxID=2793102 RepID=A0ABS1W6L3_9GAMM|nr:hydrogenase nickel incorporation protein HypB [Legionella bononiensis]MBL7478411.1 hydrogenase nickel incorporation protein HypB [Legionella bononiensis]MBL7525008.1 hydrogenase nickel incorporation protein HypB [Legionella bononiensis]MBL7561305.1 hydrogenase nickel incorporation protein HypB [Legionella bononiensis]
MCGICGCTEEMEQTTDHEHHHHDHHELDHHVHEGHLVQIEQNILAKNNQYAEDNERFFLQKNILALNLMSSPGSGKTTLLAKTIGDLNTLIDIAVVVGDQQTDFDARKIKDSGGTAIQINTGKVCHLDAHRVGHAVEALPLKEQSILIIENIGNLVCPALFDLGEHYKIVILSVTEGDNKPLKYPDMFHAADLLVITKTDLLPYVDFDLEQCKEYARRINPELEILSLSTKNGEGLQEWYEWLNTKLSGLSSLKKM